MLRTEENYIDWLSRPGQSEASSPKPITSRGLRPDWQIPSMILIEKRWSSFISFSDIYLTPIAVEMPGLVKHNRSPRYIEEGRMCLFIHSFATVTGLTINIRA